MFILKNICFILFHLIILLNYSKEEFLLFPPTSPTRVQIIVGIGFPVDLKLESVTIGYVLKAEYWLPTNASNYIDILGHPFNPTPLPITRRRREIKNTHINSLQINGDVDNSHNNKEKLISQGYDTKMKQKYEKYETDIVEIKTDDEKLITNPENIPSTPYNNEEMPNFDDTEPESILEDIKLKQPNNLDTTRWALYKGIETLARLKGQEGRPCLLRSICEAASVPFTYSSGMLSELMHIILTPSTSIDKFLKHSDNEYLKAEKLGESGEPCNQIFKECQISILGQVSGIYYGMEKFIKTFG